MAFQPIARPGVCRYLTAEEFTPLAVYYTTDAIMSTDYSPAGTPLSGNG
jgi:hypothetical protein